jgi:hypothetical protein
MSEDWELASSVNSRVSLASVAFIVHCRAETSHMSFFCAFFFAACLLNTAT